jgi:hypothetical protein
METRSLLVSPEAVVQAADEIDEVATTMVAARGRVLDALGAGDSLDGWRLGSGLGRLGEAWTADLRAYDGNLRAAADALNRAAAAYRAGDQVSAELFRQ